nr:MFS transporter [Fodinicola feengrottensis]
MNVIVQTRPSTAPTRNPWITVTMLLMGVFVVGANATMVNVAIQPTTESLGASLSGSLWIVNAYLLAFVSLLPVSGRLGDLYGPKLLQLLGLASFTAGSVLGFLAPDVGWLVFGRAVQGLGAALVTPQAIAMIARIFPAERRGRVFGVWGVVAGLAVGRGRTDAGRLGRVHARMALDLRRGWPSGGSCLRVLLCLAAESGQRPAAAPGSAGYGPADRGPVTGRFRADRRRTAAMG